MKTTRNFWPVGILAAFALFFVGLTSAIVIAATHGESLVSNDYYEQEIKFQDQITGADRAQKSGAKIVFDAQTGLLVIQVPVAQLNHKISGTVELYRPSEPKLDREFLLEPRADGTQTFNFSRLAGGLWVVRVKWTAAGGNYFLEQKITVIGK
jgi:hypothetical protein